MMKEHYKVNFNLHNTQKEILERMRVYDTTKYNIISNAINITTNVIKQISASNNSNKIISFNDDQWNKILLFSIYFTKYPHYNSQVTKFFYLSIFDKKPIIVLGGNRNNTNNIMWRNISITVKEEHADVINDCIKEYKRFKLSPIQIKRIFNETKILQQLHNDIDM